MGLRRAGWYAAGMDPKEIAARIDAMHEGTFAGELGLVMVSASRDEVRAKLTVTSKHHQPYGIVHGGVYASVIESVTSIGAGVDVFEKGKGIVGLENHTSFVRAVREGTLDIVATPLTRGRRSQLWEATIRTAEGALVATGRVRLLVVDGDAELAGKKVEPGI